MIDERQQELAALYAFDLLAGAECMVFEAELARDAALRELVSELRERAADLAFTAPQVAPPAELKARVLASIAAAPQPGTRNSEPGTPLSEPGAQSPKPETARSAALPFRVLIPWAIAAAFAVTATWLGQLYLTARTENALLRDQQALNDLEIIGARHQVEAERIISGRQLADTKRHLAQLDQQIAQSTRQLADARRALGETSTRLVASHAELTRLREEVAAVTATAADLREKLRLEGDLAQFKIATLASLAGNSPQALAVAVWNPATQQGILRVEKLPALATDKDYQLWVIDPAYANPVDGGVFTVDPATGGARITFKPNQRVDNAAKFAISLERKGGVPKAEGPILLLGD